LDYAFDIHTNLGCRCIGALLNGKNVSIREELHTGDSVEILTSKNQKPKSDWLNFTITSKARTKIKQKLREEEAKTASIGREMLFRRLKNWKISLTDDQVIGTLNKHYKLKTATDLFLKIADNQIDFHDIKNIMLNGNEEKPAEKSTYVGKPVKTDDDFLVIDEGISNVQYKFSKCCNPIFGDDVFGFITIGAGIKIHRTNCPNASRLISQYPYRIMKAEWRAGKETAAFQTGIRIIGEDEVGLSNRIMEVINGMNIPLRALQFEQKNGQLDGKIQVFINSAKQLEMLLFRLQQLKYVHKVSRISTDFNV
jgi:GTP pyrophosphokinase